jgi:hypothetical protein
MTTPVLRHQRQPRQALDRPICAQHRIRKLAQLIGAGAQASVEISPEPRQHGNWPPAGILWQAVHHGLRS